MALHQQLDMYGGLDNIAFSFLVPQSNQFGSSKVFENPSLTLNVSPPFSSPSFCITRAVNLDKYNCASSQGLPLE